VIRLTERFILEREIGSGGMSSVFLGRDEVLDRPVAIKLLKPGFGETDIGARFRREGRTAASLSHPNIVQVYDAGEGEFEGRETSFIVMEYVSGGDLKRLIDERGTLPGGDLTRLSGVAAGLAHAHERGVIHRDIKPHNILLDENGRPKLADFGIARALDATHATRTGSYLGTALYSAPEQLRGEGVTPKSDVYSLGATLYQAATGQAPFLGSPIEVASQHVSKEPTPPRELNDAVGESLEALILDCLKKDPDSRPTAADVRLGLLEAGQGVYDTRAYTEPPAAAPSETETPTETEQQARPAPATAGRRPDGATDGERRRRGVPAVLALVALLAVTGVLAASTLLGGGDGGERAPNNAGSNPSGNGQARAEQNPQGQAPSGERAQKQQAQGGLTEEAAARTVEEFYTSAAAGDYRRSSELLSPAYRQSTWSPPIKFARTFDTLERVEFTQGPTTTEANGDTATVSFSTRAVHNDFVDLTTGTATLVRENGEWKIDNLNVAPA
jgi:eukaryotic-like serine/threonine-protein kinase